MSKTWLIVIVIISIIMNAFLIGFFVGVPAIPQHRKRPTLPPLPPTFEGQTFRNLRDNFTMEITPLHQKMRELKHEILVEMISENTDRARVDSLVDAIISEQRRVQESIIGYLDTLKATVPEEDRERLYGWMVGHFGEQDFLRGKRFRHHRGQLPSPDRKSPQAEVE